MAYYPHPFYTPRGFAAPAQARPHSPPPHAFHRRHHSPLYHGHAYGLGDDDHYNYDYRPAPASIDIDEEERLARAHLASIQRRREAERAAIEREASARLHAQQQREAAIARALEIERQREVEAAIRREVERQQREHAIRVARQQREATAAAVAERRRAYEEHILARRRAIEQQHQQWRQQHQQRQLACARHRSARRPDAERRDATREADADVKDGLEAMNALFGSLFGVRFTDDKAEDATETESKTAPAAPTAPAADTKTADATTSKADKPAETNEAAFPESINDLLSAFLGLRVEPTDDTAAAASDNKVPAGLNEFLSQFGLVFEPDQPESTPDASDVPNKPEVTPAEPVSVADPPEAPLPAPASTPAAASSSKQPAAASSSAARAPAPAADSDDTPITAFLNGMTDLPPFVRDILGNVELAFKEQMKAKEQHEEEVKGKGKGVAAGERAANPVKPVSVATPGPTTASTTAPTAAPASAPAPAPTAPTTSDSLAQLSSIAHDLHLVRESFTFPPTLSFAPAPAAGSDAQPAPALLFNKTNSGYHAQTHKLLQLLLAADGIASGGDRDVRRRRKALVREVEAEIEALEKRRDDVWEVVRAEREAGGEVAEKDKEVDSGNSSDTDSVVSGAESESELNGEERKSGNGKGSGRSSRAASVVDASEDRTADLAPDDEVEVSAVEDVGETAHIEHASQHRTQQESDTEVKGFDVAPPAHVEAASEAVADAEQKSFADVVKEAPEGKEKDDVEDKDEVKEDGYELV